MEQKGLIMNILENIPLNTKKVYVKATTYSGCEIYMPVDCDNEYEEGRKKEELQSYLNGQPLPVIEPILA